jgi:HAD superfamily hydrolase (TIGR01490 family)
MSTTAALFDLDGTLCTGHIYGGLVRKRMKHPLGALRSISYMLYHLGMYPLNRAGLIDTTRFYISWGIDLAWLLKGIRKEEASHLFSEVAEELLATVRPDILEHLKGHQAEGHTLLLISGTFQPLLEVVADRLGVDYAVGTLLEERNGRYTGRLRSPFCFGEAKATMLRDFLRERGLSIDLASSYAYADRIYDIPFLEMVGNPIATYPDEGLLEYARRKGWRIIGAPSG